MFGNVSAVGAAAVGSELGSRSTELRAYWSLGVAVTGLGSVTAEGGGCGDGVGADDWRNSLGRRDWVRGRGTPTAAISPAL